MMNLFFKYDTAVEAAYIITIKGHDQSEHLSKRCQISCKDVGMPYKIWDAFDGTTEKIIPPSNMINDNIISMLKITDHYLTKGEVACALSHISLWIHCAVIDKPIVILEHDSIMVKPFLNFKAFNSVFYLGGVEWAKQNWKPVQGIPPHASEGPNYHFICRAHAYAIDPTMAKNLIAHVIKYGICAPLDIMIRADLFNITHDGIYAYDDNINKTNDTTIKARPFEGRTTTRNDKLIF
jgi:hypothetical protein